MRRVLVFVSAGFLWGSLARAGEPPPPVAPTPISATDRPTIQLVHDADQLQIQMGHLAQEKGVSKAVKELGRTLVADHERVERQLDAYLRKHGNDTKSLATTTSVDADHDLLATKIAAEFDRAFALQVMTDHQKLIDRLESARIETPDDALRTIYEELLPVLRKHKASAQSIVAASTAAART